MKRELCVAMSIVLLFGGVTANAAEQDISQYQTTFTAKVGTMDFFKNDNLCPLDAPIYIKDGYVMLPLRVFLTAMDDNMMHWSADTKIAWIQLNGHLVVCNAGSNTITVNGENIPVIGFMEMKENRIFVPLRNWKNILSACGYTVTDNDIIWDAKERIASVTVKDESRIIKVPEEESFLTGEGVKAEYSLPLMQEYDDIKNIGNGCFIASKYPEENVGIGTSMLGESYYLIDGSGKQLLAFENNEIRHLCDAGNGLLKISYEEDDAAIIDRKGRVLFSTPYSIGDFSEGCAEIRNNNKCGFIDAKGRLIVPMEYNDIKAFSEGFAAVFKIEYLDDGQIIDKWGYINKNGEVEIDLQYLNCDPFCEGMAAVETEDGWGFIGKSGDFVIVPQYKWVGYFVDGKTFVTEKDGLKTWVIDKSGNKLKLITEGKDVSYVRNSNGAIIYQHPYPGWSDGDDDMSGVSYFDENGPISEQTLKIRLHESEGLAGIYDFLADKGFYVDENGKQVISELFDQAEPFIDGYAVVANEIILEDGTVDVEWGIIQHPKN